MIKGFSIYRRDNRTNKRFREWLLVANHSIMTAALDIKSFTRPRYVAHKRTPENLYHITLGQLIELSQAKTGEDAFYFPCRVVLGLTQQQTDKALAVDVVRFAGWCCGQLDKIDKLFGQLKPSRTEEEQQANPPSFGIFGLVDWYARRMGISHEAVEQVAWSVVYECMKMDIESDNYQRRLQRIMAQKQKNMARKH